MSLRTVLLIPVLAIKKIWPKKPRNRAIAIVAILLLILALIFGFRIFMNMMIKNFFATHSTFPPPAVTVEVAKTQTWQDYISSVGSMQAVQGVDVSSVVDGQVTQILFNSGDVVQQGQPIVILDTQVLTAQLNQSKASAVLAKIDYERQSKLYQQNAASAQALDDARATWQEDVALVEQNQQLLNQKTILAPFTGVLGIREVSLGQYLSPGTAVTNLQMLTPIYVNYYVQEQDLAKLQIGQPVEVTTGTYPNQVFKGKITAIDARVSNDTRSIEVQATLPNDDLKLKPGMFVVVHTLLPRQADVVTVPQSAINYSIYGNSVFVIVMKTDKDGKQTPYVEERYVSIGEQRFNLASILKGLKAGDQVVVNGQISLRSGIPVDIVKSSISLTSES